MVGRDVQLKVPGALSSLATSSGTSDAGRHSSQHLYVSGIALFQFGGSSAARNPGSLVGSKRYPQGKMLLRPNMVP
jgi:hypothetical protein